MEEVPTNFTTGFFLKENEFNQSTAQYLDLISGNRAIQSHTVAISLYSSVTKQVNLICKFSGLHYLLNSFSLKIKVILRT